MHSHKAHKIDVSQDYPCPCCRRGRLVPITLTEAFGCNKCQQIFVVDEGGYMLEKLSTGYPYKRCWRWMGNRWMAIGTGLSENYLHIAITVLLVLLGIWLPLALKSPLNSILLWVIVAILLVVLPALMVFLAYRR